MARLKAQSGATIEFKYTCTNCQTENELTVKFTDLYPVVHPSTFGKPPVSLMLGNHKCPHCGLSNDVTVTTI